MHPQVLLVVASMLLRADVGAYTLQDGPGFDMPFPRPGMMMPGAPMMPPEFMAMAAMGGMPGPGGIMPPRPPPGPPPSGPPPQLAERSNGTPIAFSPARPGIFPCSSKVP